MALRKEAEDLAKITTNVFVDDWEWLKETYVKTGASKALRLILRKHRQVTQKKQQAAKKELDMDVELSA
jgi:asparagine synthetase A